MQKQLNNLINSFMLNTEELPLYGPKSNLADILKCTGDSNFVDKARTSTLYEHLVKHGETYLSY